MTPVRWSLLSSADHEKLGVPVIRVVTFTKTLRVAPVPVTVPR